MTDGDAFDDAFSASSSEEEAAEEVVADALQNMHHPLQSNGSKGLVVHFTHEKWDLVVNIMMGIRKAISNVMAEPNRPLCPDDYVMKEKMTLAAPKSSPAGASADGGKLTPSSCRFVDYAPMVFRKLREIWGIPTEEYMLSVGPQQILRRREERVRGRQYHAGLADDALGAVFGGQVGLLLLLLGRREVYGEDHLPHGASFLPQDSRQVLLAHRHQPRHAARALPRRPPDPLRSSQQVRQQAHLLRGHGQPLRHALQDRAALRPQGFLGRSLVRIRHSLNPSTPDAKRGDITCALKDLDVVDLNQHIRLSAENRRLFDTQLERDSQFLASCGIIDYSLLLGIHTVAGELPPAQPPAYGRYVPFWQRDWGGVLSEDKTQIYFMGVIDILIR